MEQVKTINKQIQDERDIYEMPLVNYENIRENSDIVTQESKKEPKQKLSFVWVEVFFCAIMLLGILIIQNVKNTEGLRLMLRQEIQHNLTAEELIAVGNNLEDIAEKYKNGRP